MSRMKNFVCPGCGTEMKIEEEYAGYETECVSCKKHFIIQFNDHVLPNNEKSVSEERSALSAPQSGTVKNSNRYIWGNLYIILSRIIALVIVILCAGTSVYIFSGTYRLHEEHSAAMKKSGKILLNQQNGLVSQYNQVIHTLCSPNQFTVKAPLAGMAGKFEIGETFSNEPEQKKGILHSLKVLDLYKNKVRLLSEQYTRYFLTRLTVLQRKTNQTRSVFKMPAGNYVNRSAGINANMYHDPDFYNSDKSESAGLLWQYLVELQAIPDFSANEKTVFRSFQKDIDFIMTRLIPRKGYAGTSGIRGNLGDYRNVGESTQRVSLKERHYSNLNSLIRSLTACETNNESPNWKIMLQIRLLDQALNTQLEQIKKYDAQMKQEIQRSLVLSAFIIFGGLLISFLILVFADYLKAHFDTASSLAKLLEKDK